MTTQSYLIITYVIVAIAGLAVGSFLNVLVLRFDQFASILKTRSRCPHCKEEIKWYDLVPFFSYIYLRAKCRNCEKPISFQYPVVEAVTAIVFSLIYWKFGLSLEAVLLVAISALLISIAVYDILNYEIPDILSYSALVLSIGFVILKLMTNNELLISNLIPYGYAVLIGGGFLAFLVLISKEKWMGAGDITLGALMGVLLGSPNILLGLFMAFISGSIIGLILLALKQKKLKDAVPFGPFIVFAIFVGLVWGDILINWYLGIF